MQQARELLQVRTGRRGDALDQMVLRRDLVDLGILTQDGLGRLQFSGTIAGPKGDQGIQGPPGPGITPDFSEPTSITGLTATSLFGGAFLQWDAPTYTQGDGNAYTKVYEAVYSGTGPLPTFGNAVLIGSAPFGTNVFIASGRIGTQRHYWVAAVTEWDNEQNTPTGGINGVSVTIGKVGNSDLGPLIIEAGNLANGSVTAAKLAAQAVSLTSFANGIEPVSIVGEVPSVLGTRAIFNTADGKLYRWNGSAYTPAVAANDIAGQLSDSQLAAIAAAKVTGQLNAGQLALSIGGGNLVYNSGFKSSAADPAYGTLPLGWYVYNNGAASISAVVSSGGLFGSSFFRITALSPVTSTFGLYTTHGLSPGSGVTEWQAGQTYILSVWARSAGAAMAGRKLQLLYSNMGWDSVAVISQPDLENGEWRRYIFRVVAANNASTPAGEFYISWDIGSGGPTLPAGAAYDVCAVQIEQADIVSAWAPRPDEILPGTITSLELAAGSVTAAKTAIAAINAATGGLAAGTVGSAQLVANAVTDLAIADGSVSAIKTSIAAINAATGGLAPGTVSAAQLVAESVTATAIAAGAVVAAKTSIAAIDPSTGNLTANSVTANAIAADSVVAGKIAADAVTAREILAGSVGATQIAAGAVTAGKIAAGSITADELAAGSVTAGKVAAGSIGATEIAAGAITTAKLAAGSVTANELAAESVVSSKIAAGSIVADKLAAFSVVAGKIAAGAIGATEIAAGSITTAKIAAGAVTTNEIAAGSIVTDKLAANSITTAKLAIAAVTANELAADSVVAGKIAAAAVNAREIAASAITTDKLLVTGRGEALNDDPNTQDISAWSGSGLSIVDDATSPAGRKALRCAGVGGITVLSRLMPLDATKPHHLRMWTRQEAGSSTTYLTVAFFDAAGAVISGGASGWPSLGTFHYFGLFNGALPASWTEYRISFGPGEAATIPVGARFVAVGVLSNYSGSGTQLVAGVRLMLKADADLIVDGSIIASKIAAGAIAVGSAAIQDGAIRTALIENLAVTDAKVASLAVGKLTAGDLSVGAYIRSSNFSSGSQGFYLGGDGTAELGAASIRGQLTAAQIAAWDATAVNAIIGNATITAAKIASVNADTITTGTLNASRIAAGTITTDRIQVGAVTYTAAQDVSGSSYLTWPDSASSHTRMSTEWGANGYLEVLSAGQNLKVMANGYIELVMTASVAPSAVSVVVELMRLDGSGNIVSTMWSTAGLLEPKKASGMFVGIDGVGTLRWGIRMPFCIDATMQTSGVHRFAVRATYFAVNAAGSIISPGPTIPVPGGAEFSRGLLVSRITALDSKV